MAAPRRVKKVTLSVSCPGRADMMTVGAPRHRLRQGVGPALVTSTSAGAEPVGHVGDVAQHARRTGHGPATDAGATHCGRR